MSISDRWKQFRFGGSKIRHTLHERFLYVTNFINASGEDEQKARRNAINSLVQILLRDERGLLSEKRREIYRALLEERFDHAYAEERLREMMTGPFLSEEEALAQLEKAEAEQRRQLIEFLLTLAVAVGFSTQETSALRRWAGCLGVEEKSFAVLEEKLTKEAEARRRIVSSGWGVAIAVGVLVLFIITANLLHSVIFGLLIACLLLPVEKFIETRLRRSSGFLYRLTRFFSALLLPLHKLSQAISRKADEPAAIAPEEKKLRSQRRIIRQATVLTSIIAVIAVLLVAGFAIYLTNHYVGNVRSSFRTQDKQDVPQGKKITLDRSLALVQKYLDRCPYMHNAVNFIEQTVNDPVFQEQITQEILKRSGGIFSVAAGVFGDLIAFFCNLLLTVFFALLFLLKLAEFCSGDSGKHKSEYIVRTVFNGIWLPGADDATIAEARRIIDGVFFRLRVWLKGYFTLVLIDSTVYSSLFFFLGIPFFLPLGILSGCGILLPYLGPVIACCVTLTVTVVSGEATGALLLAVIICYLIYNGVIEQFILYPAVIGEALGLSTLETIVVVLLGAVFAGIAGMLLALPTASVAKYIIPQLYHAFLHRGKLS